MPEMTTGDVDIIDKRREFESYVRVDRYILKHKLFDGGQSAKISREVLDRGHAAAVLLYDPDLDLLVMIEQFRAGAFAALKSGLMPAGDTPWLVECVAGIIEDGENPEDVVRREAVEEADCVIRELVPLYHYYSSPGCLSESVFLFCGRVDARGAGGIHGIENEGEDIRVFTVTPEQAISRLKMGRINNSMTMIALQWLDVNRENLRREWRTPSGS